MSKKKPTPPALSMDEAKFLRKIAADPGVAATDLPRANRGKTIKSLELAGLIHYGPGGWYPTELGARAIGAEEPDVAEHIAELEKLADELGGTPEEK